MLKNYPAALNSLDAAITSNPHFTVAYMARGYARYMNSKNQQSTASHQSQFSELQLISADQMLKGSLIKEAMDDFSKALEFNPRLIFAWFNKGNIYYDEGDYTSAIQSFSNAINIDPEFGEAYFNRGLAYLNAGNKNQAFADLSKAGELGVIPSYNILKRMK